MILLRIFLPLMLSLIALMVACSDSDSDNAGDGARVTSIGQALAADEGSEVSVRGHLISDSDGRVRLCSLLLESFPPQCGGDRIELFDFDMNGVPGTQRSQNPGEIQTLIWTNYVITVAGIRNSEGLGTAQLTGAN